MTQYLSFVAFAAVLALAPGPDTLLTLRATLLGGRQRGIWTILGICTACSVQGIVAASGLGALLMSAQGLFTAVRWAGAAYLAFLGVMALREAWRMRGSDFAMPVTSPAKRWAAAQQGFLTNITNPKVLAFNIAVLPQFIGPGASFGTLLAYALTLMAIGAVVLLVLMLVAASASRALQRVSVRRAIEGGTGVVMLGFAGGLAAEAS